MPVLATAFWGLPLLDVSVILVYFAVMVWIGYRAMKKIKNQEDFFLGGRRFGKLIQTFAAFGQATSAESGTVTTTMVRNNGVAGIWAGLLGGLLVMPIFWMTTIWYRRMRYLTLGDFFEERYGSQRMAAFYAVCQALFFMLVVALAFNALGKTMAAMTPMPEAELTAAEKTELQQAHELEKLEGADYETLDDQQKEQLKELRFLNPRRQFSYIDPTVLIIVVAFIVLLYAVSGGLEAAFVTDTIQGIFTIILSLLLIPFAAIKLNKISGTDGLLGPFQAIHQKLPESFFEMWGSPLAIEFRWYWLLAFALLSTVNVFVQANQLTACGSAKDEYTARTGFVSGIFLKRYSQVIWGLVALMTVALYGSVVQDPDHMWGHAAKDLLGPLEIGLVGLLIACMMAALMSLADCLMITSSSLITSNLYRPLHPNRSERHYVWVGRIASLLFILGSVWIALQFKTVFALFKLIWMFNCVLAASFLMGMLWRRANRAGAWASMLVMTVFTVLLPVLMPLFPGVRTGEYFLKTTNPPPMTRTYVAREMDVFQRQQEMEQWDLQEKMGRAAGERPEKLISGKKFTKTFILPHKSVFWAEDVAVGDNGQKRGQGMLKVELVMLDWLGFDLSKNSYSFNETLTAIFRIVLPFGVLILISLLTRPDDTNRLDRFYARMRTEVQQDRVADARELALSQEEPHRLDHLKLFPNSNWEFRKWNATDYRGVAWSILGSVGCFLLLYLVVNLCR